MPAPRLCSDPLTTASPATPASTAGGAFPVQRRLHLAGRANSLASLNENGSLCTGTHAHRVTHTHTCTHTHTHVRALKGRWRPPPRAVVVAFRGRPIMEGYYMRAAAVLRALRSSTSTARMQFCAVAAAVARVAEGTVSRRTPQHSRRARRHPEHGLTSKSHRAGRAGCHVGSALVDARARRRVTFAL